MPDVFGRNSKGLAVDLTLNAIGAMSGTAPEERDLLIRTEKADDDGVRVAVVDSGPELPPALFEHLFEPFYTTKAAGLGIRLSICCSIIETLGGRLQTSANVPHGAVFQFTRSSKAGH